MHQVSTSPEEESAISSSFDDEGSEAAEAQTSDVMRKPADSVLTNFIGLDEAEMEKALADPLEAMEEERYRGEFLPMDSEAKVGAPAYRDYRDEEYRQGMQEARQQRVAGVLREGEYRDAEERLQDEYKDWKLMWWLAGGNFDYFWYGIVGDPALPDENVWLPLQVRLSFRTSSSSGPDDPVPCTWRSPTTG